MIVTATHLKITGIKGWLHFSTRIRKIRTQLSTAEGLIFSRFKGLKTLTGWESFEALKAFRNSGPHLEAMKNLHKIGKAKSITWESETGPDWNVAEEKLRGVGF